MGEVGLPGEVWDRSEPCPNCEAMMGAGEPGEKCQIFRSVAIANGWDPDETLFVCAECEPEAIAIADHSDRKPDDVGEAGELLEEALSEGDETDD